MRSGVKGVSIAVLTSAVLTTTACGSSGTTTSSGAHTSGQDTSTSTSTSTVVTTPGSPATASGGTWTRDQISKLMLTDQDAPSYARQPAHDNTKTNDSQDVVTAGGSACQKFEDAWEGLSTKYGTTAEVDHELVVSGGGRTIDDSVLVLPSADKARAVMSDLAAGLKDCKTLSMPAHSGGSVSMTLTPVPALTGDGRVGVVTAFGGAPVSMTAELVQVGTAVSMVALMGPTANDAAGVQATDTMVKHLSDIQVGRLKAAAGLS